MDTETTTAMDETGDDFAPEPVEIDPDVILAIQKELRTLRTERRQADDVIKLLTDQNESLKTALNTVKPAPIAAPTADPLSGAIANLAVLSKIFVEQADAQRKTFEAGARAERNIQKSIMHAVSAQETDKDELYDELSTLHDRLDEMKSGGIDGDTVKALLPGVQNIVEKILTGGKPA
jgi:hypothetical protein